MKDKSKYIRLIYGALLGLMTVILGALLIGFAMNIYVTGTAPDYSGASVYTRERVAERLSKVAPAFWLWVVMAVVGFVLWEVFPAPALNGKNDIRYTLHRLKKRIPETVDESLQASLIFVKREQKILKILYISAAAVCAAVAVYIIVYLAIPSNFPAVENKSIPVLNMVKCVMPCVAAAFAVCLAAAVYEGVSAKKQLKHVTALTKGVKGKAEYKDKIYCYLQSKSENKFFFILLKAYERRILILRIIVGCVGVAFVIAGIFNGSMRDMLIKAIRICTECIGLG